MEKHKRTPSESSDSDDDFGPQPVAEQKKAITKKLKRRKLLNENVK
jgi:hypothetical protein